MFLPLYHRAKSAIRCAGTEARFSQPKHQEGGSHLFAQLGKKKKKYADKRLPLRMEFEPRWREGIYMGLSDQVDEGHLVYVDGTFLHTKNVRPAKDLVDPEYLKPENLCWWRRQIINLRE